jgi:hypothetical protein
MGLWFHNHFPSAICSTKKKGIVGHFDLHLKLDWDPNFKAKIQSQRPNRASALLMKKIIKYIYIW